MNLQSLQQEVEQAEAWGAARVGCILMRQAKEQMSRHDIEAQIAKVEREVMDRIGRAIQRAIR